MKSGRSGTKNTETSRKTLGDINVEMGDGNRIGHLGHKITYQQPPPSPNAIYQNDRVVGEFAGDPVQAPEGIVFERLFVEAGFDQNKAFSIQGVCLVVVEVQIEARASIAGRPPQRTLFSVLCSVVGDDGQVRQP